MEIRKETKKVMVPKEEEVLIIEIPKDDADRIARAVDNLGIWAYSRYPALLSALYAMFQGREVGKDIDEIVKKNESGKGFGG